MSAAPPPQPGPAVPKLLGADRSTWGASSITALIALVASTFVTQAQAPNRETVRAMVREEISVHTRSDHALELRSVEEVQKELGEMTAELKTIRETLGAIKLELAIRRSRTAETVAPALRVPLPVPP